MVVVDDLLLAYRNDVRGAQLRDTRDGIDDNNLLESRLEQPRKEDSSMLFPGL